MGKWALGIAVAAVAVIMVISILPAMAQPTYTINTGCVRQPIGNGNVVKYVITTVGNIPHTADAYINSVLLFGLGCVDATGGFPFDFVNAVIHPTLGKDSKQNPNGWHIHIGTFGPTAACAGVGFGNQATFTVVNGAVSINGNVLTMKLKASDAVVSTVSFGSAFQLIPGNTPPALCAALP